MANEAVTLTPRTTFRRAYPEQLSAGTYSVRIVDASGRELLRHTEGSYDFADRNGVSTGPQPQAHPPALAARTDGGLRRPGPGRRNWKASGWWRSTRIARACRSFPDSANLHRAAGRLLVGLKQYDAAVPFLRKALSRISNDREIAYYLGIAERDTNAIRARMNFDTAEQYGPHRPPSLLNLAATLVPRRGARRGLAFPGRGGRGCAALGARRGPAGGTPARQRPNRRSAETPRRVARHRSDQFAAAIRGHPPRRAGSRRYGNTSPRIRSGSWNWSRTTCASIFSMKPSTC